MENTAEKPEIAATEAEKAERIEEKVKNQENDYNQP